MLLEDYPLTETMLSKLQRGDRIALPHPDGGTIELRVERADAEHGGRHLMLVQSDGLVSTFTEATAHSSEPWRRRAASMLWKATYAAAA